MITSETAKAVDKLLKDCFETDMEAELVNSLRAGDKLMAEHLLPFDDDETDLMGYIGYSAVTTENGDSTELWGLGPMAIFPGAQRQGIGLDFLEFSLEAVREAGCRGVVLLGHTGFYTRAGFRPAADFGLTFGEHEDHFMALELAPGALSGVSGRVRYADEFYGL